MQVVEETEEKLVIEDRPWFLAGVVWLLGLAALSAAILGQLRGPGETLLVLVLGAGTTAIAWYFMPFQRFEFDRASGTLTRTIARVTGSKKEVRPLSTICQAASQGNLNDGARLERVALLTDDEPYPLEFGFSGTSRTEVIKAINAWLDTSKK